MHAAELSASALNGVLNLRDSDSIALFDPDVLDDLVCEAPLSVHVPFRIEMPRGVGLVISTCLR